MVSEEFSDEVLVKVEEIIIFVDVIFERVFIYIVDYSCELIYIFIYLFKLVN